jgi:hypothetical protein
METIVVDNASIRSLGLGSDECIVLLVAVE